MCVLTLVVICFQSFIHHQGIFLLIGICDLNEPVTFQKQEGLDFLFSLVAALLSGVSEIAITLEVQRRKILSQIGINACDRHRSPLTL